MSSNVDSKTKYSNLYKDLNDKITNLPAWTVTQRIAHGTLIQLGDEVKLCIQNNEKFNIKEIENLSKALYTVLCIKYKDHTNGKKCDLCLLNKIKIESEKAKILADKQKLKMTVIEETLCQLKNLKDNYSSCKEFKKELASCILYHIKDKYNSYVDRCKRIGRPYSSWGKGTAQFMKEIKTFNSLWLLVYPEETEYMKQQVFYTDEDECIHKQSLQYLLSLMIFLIHKNYFQISAIVNNKDVASAFTIFKITSFKFNGTQFNL